METYRDGCCVDVFEDEDLIQREGVRNAPGGPANIPVKQECGCSFLAPIVHFLILSSLGAILVIAW